MRGLCQDSPLHKALFWVAVAVLQLDEVNLYSAGTALLEQNLHTLDSLRIFNDKVSELSVGIPRVCTCRIPPSRIVVGLLKSEEVHNFNMHFCNATYCEDSSLTAHKKLFKLFYVKIAGNSTCPILGNRTGMKNIE